ncbi:MAG: mechanosensitive ion channel family protein [Ardenticatenaceae bacterium]|nr:mechanosensitive ion channel family protein [Ardenticatenaceae bacterium]
MIEQIDFSFLRNADFLIKVGESLIILVLIWVIRRVIIRIVTQTTDNTSLIYTWRKVSEYVAILVAGLLIGSIWLRGFESASTYLGLLSAGLAISLQDLITNLFGWMYLMAKRPFEVGDRIEIGDQAGDVIDIHWFHFTILEIRNWIEADQNTGRLVHVPNRFVFTRPLANFSSGIPHIWNEVPVTVTFESDWLAAKKILFELAEQHSLRPTKEQEETIHKAARRANIRMAHLTPTVYTKVSGSGIVLTLRYLCTPRSRRSSEEEVWEDVLKAFAEREDIDFAYNTQRIFYHPVEGKTVVSDHQTVGHPMPHSTNPKSLLDPPS